MKTYRIQAPRGFSIIELMISLTIGLVMIVFVTSLYVRSKGSYEVNDDNSRMQQEARLIMSMLGRNLSQAGFGPPPYRLVGTGMVSSFHIPELPVATRPLGLRVCDGGFAAPTTLSDTTCAGGTGAPGFEVSYVSDDTVNVNTGAGTDCNGQTVAPDANGVRRVVNRFYLTGTQGNMSLNCIGNGSATGQPLLSNVENMRLTLGLDSSGLRRPDAFFTTAAAARAVEDAIDPKVDPFSRVVSVGVCLQLTSANTVNNQNEQSYVDCAGTRITPTDRKIHMAMTSVYTLRNNSDTTLLIYPPK